MELTHRTVFTLCWRVLGDRDDAAEATQDTFLKAWRGLGGFRGDAQFSTWLYRIATNAAISKLRTRGRTRKFESRVQDEVLERKPAAGSTEATAEARMGVEAVQEALVRLPETYRTVLVLRDVYGLAISDIARQLKISETATKVRLHRGRKKLKDMVDPTEDEATRIRDSEDQ